MRKGCKLHGGETCLIPRATKEIEDEIYNFLSQLPEDLKNDIHSLEGGGLCDNVFTVFFMIVSFALIYKINLTALQVLLASPKYIDSYFGDGTWRSYLSAKAIKFGIHQHTPCLTEEEFALDATMALPARVDAILSYPMSYFTKSPIKLFSTTVSYLSQTYNNHLSCNARNENFQNAMAIMFILLGVLEAAFTASHLSKTKRSLYQFLKEKFCGLEVKLQEECPNPPILMNM